MFEFELADGLLYKRRGVPSSPTPPAREDPSAIVGMTVGADSIFGLGAPLPS